MSDMQQKNGVGPKASCNEPARKSVVAVVMVVCVLTLLGGVIYLQKNKAPSQPTGETPATSTQDDPQSAQNEHNSNLVPSHMADPVKPPTTAPILPRAATPAMVDPNRPQPSPQMRQLVKSLTDLDFKNTPMTAEKATEWKQNLQQLVQSGAAAVPALQEFFERNQDLRFDGAGGTNFFGESTLRQALLKALPSIGGPEALALQTQVLQTTADPQEIALLAKQLDAQVPEQYRQMAMDAARAALEMAAGGKLPGRDVGPLFGVLQQFGGSDVAPEMQRYMSNWRYYGAIALADMPEGAGIPALVDMAQNPSNRSQRNIALQMLAQAAPQSDFARQALLIEAKNGEVSGATWIEIGSALSGNIYGIGNPEGSMPVSGEKRWHLAQGEQNFYSRPDPNLTAEGINQRLALIDELMAGNANQTAIDSLQRAKAALQARLVAPPALVNPVAPVPGP